MKSGPLRTGQHQGAQCDPAPRKFLPRSKTPAGSTLATSARVRCCPCCWESKGTSVLIISRLPRGFGTCCLRFKSGVTPPHARLASGRLAGLCREELNPLDRDERFPTVSKIRGAQGPASDGMARAEFVYKLPRAKAALAAGGAGVVVEASPSPSPLRAVDPHPDFSATFA